MTADVHAHDHAPSTPLVAASVAVVVWGIGPLFVKQIGASGITVATYRVTCAIPVMFLILAFTGGKVTKQVWKVAAPAGVLFAADIGFGFSSFEHTSIANATIIGALSPLLILLASRRMFGERLRSIDYLWFAGALGGTLLVVLAGHNSGQRSWVGDALATASLFVWTVYFLYVKRKRVDGVHPFAFMTCVITCAAAALIPYSLLVSRDLDAIRGTDFIWLFCLILGPGALGHGLMTWATRYVNINVTSVMTLAGPVVSTIGAFIFFDQSLRTGQVIGGAIVLISIALVLVGHANADIMPEPLEGE